jgi:hypothetical protein
MSRKVVSKEPGAVQDLLTLASFCMTTKTYVEPSANIGRQANLRRRIELHFSPRQPRVPVIAFSSQLAALHVTNPPFGATSTNSKEGWSSFSKKEPKRASRCACLNSANTLH